MNPRTGPKKLAPMSAYVHIPCVYNSNFMNYNA